MIKQITATFTQLNSPIDTLSPTITILDITDSNNPITVINNAIMIAIGHNSGGYIYDFLTYNASKNYYVIIDGGESQLAPERYAYATNENYIKEIIDSNWDELNNEHLIEGSTGKNLSDISQYFSDERFFGYGK